MPDQNQPKQIELADAYKETCTALGEAVTMQRLLSQSLMEAQMKVSQLEAQIEQMTAQSVDEG